MSYNSQRVPSFAAYGGVPQDAAYGGIPTDEAYRLAREKKEQNNTLLPDNISIQPNNYTQNSNSYKTESAWGYPNSTSSPFYNKMGYPYSTPMKYLTTNKYRVGSLSQEFESNKNPAAIGEDDKGGPSYGLYQIATFPGTMNEYLQYLAQSPNKSYQHYATILNDAGGNTGALNKTTDFQNAWINLAQEPEFASSQSEFIGKNRYERILNRIKDINGLNLQNRHPVVSDVIRSMAVQHGKADIPIHNALGRNSDISSWSDEDIIEALYDARNAYVSRLRYNTPRDQKMQQNILNIRYPKERRKALEALSFPYDE